MSKLRLIPYAVLTAGGLLAGEWGCQRAVDVRASIASRTTSRTASSAVSRRADHPQRGVIASSEGEQAINRAQRQAEADGHVSPQERQRIDRMVHQENREIYRQSHDSQQAGCGQSGAATAAMAGAATVTTTVAVGTTTVAAGIIATPIAATGAATTTNGSWNQWRDHNGWNNASNGWNHNGRTRNGNNGWNHNGNGRW